MERWIVGALGEKAFKANKRISLYVSIIKYTAYYRVFLLGEVVENGVISHIVP